ncbi:MAG TPA: DEAD/DEAH box helicase [Beijerinckiaceae bacterium]|jgi:transcription-repair coupling factor (superfamily II helicase)
MRRAFRSAPRRAKPGPGAAPVEVAAAATLGGEAVQLLKLAREAGAGGLVVVAGSESRAERLGRLLRGLDPARETIVVPPWDCLPYDRTSPSREAMGRRMAALRRLAGGGEGGPEGAVVVTVPDALVQRVPPRDACREAGLALAAGEDFAAEALEAALSRLGYVADERVDEPGEMAFRGQVVDIFPAGASTPVRIEHDGGRIAAIRAFDPATQRTVGELDRLSLDPASEVLPREGEGRKGGDEGEGEGPERASNIVGFAQHHRCFPATSSGFSGNIVGVFAGLGHRLPELYPALDTLFDYVPGATLVLEPGASDRLAHARAQIADAYEARAGARAERLREGLPPPLPPERLYLTETEWDARVAAHPVVRLQAPEGPEAEAVPRFALEPSPRRAFSAFLREAVKARRRVVLAAGDEQALRLLARRAEQAMGSEPSLAADWNAVLKARPGTVLTLGLDLDRGFVDKDGGVVAVAAADLLGAGAAPGRSVPARPEAALLTNPDLRLGDAVIHLDYGMGMLSGLEALALGQGAGSEAVRLAYKDDAKLLVPVEEMDRIWRYGAGEGLALDHLDGDAWAKRRARLMEEIAEAARGLAGKARERAAMLAPKLKPPARAYERFVSGFPFTETPDQARAISDVLAHLASGRPTNRLVCGDVGYGKTEVALRAAAAAALSDKQVAVLAPTTVLVRQHLQTFTRRFRGTDVSVAHLSRLAKPAEAKRVKAGLADGSIRVVIGTHALLAKGVRFENLGLVVIDEEQRFGTAHKEKIRALAQGIHVLTLTATPIPRTLQGALAGLLDLSLIATAPARRRPIRTFVTPFDRVTMREALLRERRRGGQSFLVCPRIEDIEPMSARLKELVPELQVLVAHGKMPAEDVDETMVRFADGDGDVLLSTNIIENGLDVPRANTMLVWRADRFGLAQLHQLRGRVGRGRMRGVAYLLTDPGDRIAPATEKRLKTLETLDRLGAGFAISARDLDQRGAGDLLGDTQAGHVRLIGAGLYRHLLERALKTARGEAVEDDWSPELNLGVGGRIPEDYVPEAEVRINLYARLARAEGADAVDALAAEIEDRFGEPPDEVHHLLAAARLRQLCRMLGIARIDAGPKAVALTFRHAERWVEELGGLLRDQDGGFVWRDDRLVCERPTDTPAERLDLALTLLERLAEEP